jgi:hypothetical protein
MNVLVGCEFSGRVRDAFRRRGHEAWSCDLEGVEPEGEWPNYHLFGDVRWFLDGSRGPCTNWDLAIFHPSCTHLAVSGARWFKHKREEQAAALDFVRELLAAPVPRIALENPVSIISSHIRKPDQIVQPWMFGDPEYKATCWWLKNLPPLKHTKYVFRNIKSSVHRAPPGPNRGQDRSRTFPGMAEAIADQWGTL